MNKKNVLVVLLLCCFACNKPQQEYDSQGHILKEFFTKNGEMNGKYTEFFKNGSIKVSGNYEKNKRNGLFKYYDENGKILKEITFSDDIKSGLVKTYLNDKLEKEFYKNNDKINGLFKEYYSNGILKDSGQFIDDNAFGSHSFYDENGKLKEVKEYIIIHNKPVLNQYRTFGDDGRIKPEKSNYIEIHSKSDTISLGEKFEFSITLQPVFKKMRLIIGPFDKNYVLNGRADTLDCASLVCSYSVKQGLKGENIIRGIVVDYKPAFKDGKIDGYDAREIFFTKKYFVK